MYHILLQVKKTKAHIHIQRNGGIHLLKINQTHVLNILIGTEPRTEERVEKKFNSSSTNLSHYGFCVTYLQTPELPESVNALTVYFPSENSQAVVFECLHGLT